jgi:hypothetical protein
VWQVLERSRVMSFRRIIGDEGPRNSSKLASRFRAELGMTGFREFSKILVRFHRS